MYVRMFTYMYVCRCIYCYPQGDIIIISVHIVGLKNQSSVSLDEIILVAGVN